MYQNFSYRTCHEKYERDSNKVKTSLCKDKEISNETLIWVKLHLNPYNLPYISQSLYYMKFQYDDS